MSNEDEIVIEDHELDWSDNDEIVIEDHELDLIYRTDEYTKEKLQSALTHFESDVAFCKGFKESFHGKKKPTLPNFPGHISENIVKSIPMSRNTKWLTRKSSSKNIMTRYISSRDIMEITKSQLMTREIDIVNFFRPFAHIICKHTTNFTGGFECLGECTRTSE